MHNEIPRLKLDDLQSDFPGVFDSAKYVDVGIGWLPLIREFIATALPLDPSLSVMEMKQKWGCLRIWSDTPVIGARLAKVKAEIKSSYVCEVCGEPAFVRRPPPGRYAWWQCLCDEHASPDQRSWGTRLQGPMYGYAQVEGSWYRYDEDADVMVPSEPPARWR
ncbi:MULTISPECIES: hypothetical protein [Rhizobium]|uniref:hypothetical protein n=1 Tax=Rhizobium TaxID=379 RepID=UPI0004627050|nr:MULTISPECIES: hypothetical protein [Rhizobium]UFS81520.1 hypothetical protein LPB79_24935 [Rhizobium sp. T136]